MNSFYISKWLYKWVITHIYITVNPLKGLTTKVNIFFNFAFDREIKKKKKSGFNRRPCKTQKSSM